jgi:outer membrane protein assembly factor BamB
MTRSFLVVLASFLVGLDAAAADNWPHWRGPNADGTAPRANPPTKWDGASGLNIRWKAPLTDRGSATPIVWGNLIVVVAAEKTDRVASDAELPKPTLDFKRNTTAPNHYYRFRVSAFDRDTGKPVWDKVATEQVPHEGHHETHTYAAGSPTTDGERIYVSFGSFGIFCYDLAGNPIWKRELGRLNTRLGWGEAVTPVIHGGRLLLNWDQEGDSALHCLDAKTGEPIWTAKRDEKSTWTTPLVVEHGGRTQVILNGTTRIRSHDLATGEVIWSCSGMTVNPIPSALRHGDAVIVMSGYRGAAAVSIPLASRGDLTPDKATWLFKKATPYVPSPALVGDRLYFTEANLNLLTVLDAKTGKAVYERERLPGVRQFYASPIFAGGRIYFTDRDGTTIVLKPGDSLDVLATNKLGDPVDASPVPVGDRLYLRGEKHLWCIGER